ncbi:MAG TPA: hypothetical protein DDW50_06670 [Firmicutes bacterium]|nr:hypothetical protein [Bacillota bacterium]
MNEGVQKGRIRSDIDLHLIMLVISRDFENLLSSEMISEIPFSFHEIVKVIITVSPRGSLLKKSA